MAIEEVRKSAQYTTRKKPPCHVVKADQLEWAKINVLCSDILPIFPTNLGPNTLRTSKIWIWVCFSERTDKLWMSFIAIFEKCHVFRFHYSALWLISSHDSPPPSSDGNRGRRRTCLREMWCLKSIEVEDKKNFGRKVSRYLRIY